MTMAENNWSDYQMLVLHEIERLSDSIKDLTRLTSELKLELESLKVKTGFIATLAGFASSASYNIGKFLIER